VVFTIIDLSEVTVKRSRNFIFGACKLSGVACILGQAEWALADYGDFLVHIFSPKARQYYDLERLWRNAKVVEIPPE